MINLRYHIVSLTAVFLAIGIGLTLGSTFLDRATVENLNGQLQRLEDRLGEREQEVEDLRDQVEQFEQRRTALDEQASGLLGGVLESVPVVMISARGADEADVEQTVSSLAVAGADVQGVWWLTDRWALEDEGAITDLAEVLEEDSDDPSRLRRTAITRMGGELRARQLLDTATGDDEPDADEPDADEPTDSTDSTDTTDTTDTTHPIAPPTEGGTGVGTGPPSGELELVDALVEAGFIEFEAVGGGPDGLVFPDGTRTVFGAGSPEVPDDLVLEPLIRRLARASDTPVLGVVGSVMPENGAIADAVAVIREDEVLRAVVPTVDELEHFEGWAAMVLSLDQVTEGVVGHYGLADSASRLLPPMRTP
ncbi:MAG: copper transporter [Acidimicrobiales bacterium]|nr:copper transporter [Acidimicrobiales bacterium]